MAKAKITHPVFRSILGIGAVILIVIFSNWLVSSTSVGSRSIDLTEDRRHTLTEGTKAILAELESPVIIRYYATRKSEAMPRRIKTYIRRVDDLLKRYATLSGGKDGCARHRREHRTRAVDRRGHGNREGGVPLGDPGVDLEPHEPERDGQTDEEHRNEEQTGTEAFHEGRQTNEHRDQCAALGAPASRAGGRLSVGEGGLTR